MREAGSSPPLAPQAITMFFSWSQHLDCHCSLSDVICFVASSCQIEWMGRTPPHDDGRINFKVISQIPVAMFFTGSVDRKNELNQSNRQPRISDPARLCHSVGPTITSHRCMYLSIQPINLISTRPYIQGWYIWHSLMTGREPLVLMCFPLGKVCWHLHVMLLV